MSTRINISMSMSKGEPAEVKTNAMSPETARACAREQPSRLRDAPRCQARNRAGKSCRCAAMKGKRVCRLHGGRAGAPKGEANGAYRNGIWTGDAIALRKSAAKLIRRVAKPIDIEELIDTNNFADAAQVVRDRLEALLVQIEQEKNPDGTPHERPRKRRMSDLSFTLTYMSL